GYYKPGAYGIRIENLVLEVGAAAVPGAEKPLYAFETLTLAPIDRRLIQAEMLTPDEALWLDGYHARVFDALSPLLHADSRAAPAAPRAGWRRGAGGRHSPARATLNRRANSFARSGAKGPGSERGAPHAVAAARAADRDGGRKLALAQYPGAGDPRAGGQVR